MSEALGPHSCVTPHCPNAAVSALVPFCSGCLKAHAIIASQRAGDATRKRLHDAVDGAFARGVNWLAERLLRPPDPPGPRP